MNFSIRSKLESTKKMKGKGMIEQKTIWMLWFQGEKEMPELVRMCYESWYMMNSDYQIVLLDQTNLNDYVKIPDSILNNRNISVQSLSNVVRINLLSQHGGIWVDATCYCIKPLDQWLPENFEFGFFAFDSPGSDRMISSWFLAANRGNELMVKLTNGINELWIDNPNIKLINTTKYAKLFTIKFIRKALLRFPLLWFSFFFIKLLKVYPYFIFHYFFHKAYLTNKDFKTIWDNTNKISADIPHKMQHKGFDSPISEEMKLDIDNNRIPMYKLSHKMKYDAQIENSTMSYLFRKHKNKQAFFVKENP